MDVEKSTIIRRFIKRINKEYLRMLILNQSAVTAETITLQISKHLYKLYLLSLCRARLDVL